MKRIAICVIALLILTTLACEKNSVEKEGSGDEVVYTVSDENSEMNKIIAEARQNIGQFISALRDPSPSQSDFSVKYPFETDPEHGQGNEHIWLLDIKVVNGEYRGTIANDPFYIKKLKLGDEVPFDINKISDWKYIEDGSIVGGNSIKYIYNQMSESEKEEFVEQTGYKFKE